MAKDSQMSDQRIPSTSTRTRRDTADAEPRLIFLSGPLRGKSVKLVHQRTTVGRNESNDITVPEKIISSSHTAVVQDAEGEFWLEDLDSTNGTFLNHRRIERAKLRDGDVVCLCRAGPEFRFQLGGLARASRWPSTKSARTRTDSVDTANLSRRPQDIHANAVQATEAYWLRREIWWFSSILTVVVIFAAAVGLLFFLFAPRHGDPLASRAARPLSGNVAGNRALRHAPQTPTQTHPCVELTPKLEPIYGSLFHSYRQRSLGTVAILNQSGQPLIPSVLEFSFVGDDRPLLVAPFRTKVPEIPAWGRVEVDVAPRLSERALVNKTRDVKARLTLRIDGNIVAHEVFGHYLYARHIFNWETEERASAFVDPDDLAVKTLVTRAWKHRPTTRRSEFPPANVVAALTVLTALADLDLRYQPDAENPISHGVDWKANDRVKYPTATLMERTGDCDDLSVLCCSLLERTGVRTALAVTAGHVFFLFDTGFKAPELDLSPFESRTVFAWQGRLWMPIEPTALAGPDATFSAAWAAAWSRHEALVTGQVKLIEVRDGWKGGYIALSSEPEASTAASVKATMSVSEELGQRVRIHLEGLRARFRKNLSAKMAAAQAELKGHELQHAMGILYAKSGLLVEARRVFCRLLFGSKELPAIATAECTLHESTDDQARILASLAICLALASHSGSDLDTAVAFTELAVRSFSAPAERAELMLRLASLHRLRGSLAEERLWLDRATQLDPRLQVEYEQLVAVDGTVAGPDEELYAYLRSFLRR